jgi:hypothetical protein
MHLGRLPATSALCALAVLFAACSHDLKVRYPEKTELPTGSITVLLTRPARDLTIAVNGLLVARRAHTREVHVTGVPAGSTDVIIAAGGGSTRIEKHFEIWVSPGENVAIPLGAPEQSMASAMNMGMLTIAAWLLSRAIYLAFI